MISYNTNLYRANIRARANFACTTLTSDPLPPKEGEEARI
jgi:hypothetical protein